MNKVFAERVHGRFDWDTQKLMEEEGWRKADEQEENAFWGYFLSMKRKKSGFIHLRSAALLLAVVAVAELAFEYLCKSDPSYNPFPILVCLVLVLLVAGVSQICYALQLGRQKMLLSGGIYVINGIACTTGRDRIQIMINDRVVTGETYAFQEMVSPMDYVFDEHGLRKGFYVRLFMGLDSVGGVTKVVLGTHGYDHYLRQYSKKLHL